MPRHLPPESLIRFMGKSGFITRELWQEHFHSTQKKEWNRKAWAELINRKYCHPHPESRLGNVLVLNRKSPVVQCILQSSPVPSQRGALLAHDEILYWGMLNAQAKRAMVEWLSEAELKASGNVAYRIESTDGKSKYPDALALVRDASGPDLRVVAVECELTQKTARRYERMLDAYAGFSDMAGLIFITDSPSIKAAIVRQIEKGGSEGIVPIRFVTTNEWKNDAEVLLKASSRSHPDPGASEQG